MLGWVPYSCSSHSSSLDTSSISPSSFPISIQVCNSARLVVSSTPLWSLNFEFIQVRRIEFTEYVVCLEEHIRRFDCRIQYAVLGRRFDTSYPTGGYGVSSDQSE
ncbi:hypothetical protein Tco_1540767 [Tanacetum coccineum]